LLPTDLNIMFTGLVEAPVCVYCDTMLYLDDRLVSTEAEEDREENEDRQSVGPEGGTSGLVQNGQQEVPLDSMEQSTAFSQDVTLDSVEQSTAFSQDVPLDSTEKSTAFSQDVTLP
jgi:hypothetical protein